MTFRGPTRTARSASPRRVARRDQARVPAAREGVPPGRGGRAALPRFLAIQAAYEQLVGDGPSKAVPRPPSRPSSADPARADATHRAYGGRTRRTRPPGSGPASGAGRAGSGGQARPPGSTGPANGSGTAGQAGDAATGASGTSERPIEGQGHARLDVLRRGRRDPVRARLGWRQLVRHHQRHVLDHQPEGVRGPAQARTRVPSAPAPGAAAAGRAGPAGRRRSRDRRARGSRLPARARAAGTGRRTAPGRAGPPGPAAIGAIVASARAGSAEDGRDGGRGTAFDGPSPTSCSYAAWIARNRGSADSPAASGWLLLGQSAVRALDLVEGRAARRGRACGTGRSPGVDGVARRSAGRRRLSR